MIKKIFSGTIIGIRGELVTVEVALGHGRKGLSIVGMGDTAIHESKKRILTALDVLGYEVRSLEISVNLAPADLKKEGTLFDLPIALAILSAMDVISIDEKFLQETLFLGELSFDGNLYSRRSMMNLALDAGMLGKKRLVVPAHNYTEVSLVDNIECLGFFNLTDIIRFFQHQHYTPPRISHVAQEAYDYGDFADIKGHEQAKRLFQIAAAGHHNIILVGSPGSGKTMLASRMGALMKPLNAYEATETTRIYAASNINSQSFLVKERPFRTPHHTISQAGMVGGGNPIMPGEISLAHNGILFMDEFTEFRRNVIESLRQPMESGKVVITRAQTTVEFPAKFILVSALNPCPCGYLGDAKRKCECSPMVVYNYLSKISGPLLDRIDLQMYISSISHDELATKNKQTSTADLKIKIERALKAQEQRFGTASFYNSSMTTQQIDQYCKLSDEGDKIVKLSYEKLGMSMRSLHKLLKISRTIADLEGSEMIQDHHLKEALMYRGIEQKINLLKKRIL